MGKVILVTGATSGIGLVCARMLAKAGHKVYGCGRRVMETVETEPFSYIRCDVTDQTSVESLVSTIEETSGRIDALIICAGYGLGGGVEDTTTEEAREQFETNVFGAHRVIRQVLPIMRRQESGSILVVSSVAAEFAIPFQGFYSSSKMALDGLILALRMEVKPYKIQAACVNPGDVRSGFTSARKQAAGLTTHSPYYIASMKSIDTMKRDEMNGIAPEKVAKLIVELVGRKKLAPKYFVEAQYKAVMVLKRLLPMRAVEALLESMYLR